MAFILAGGQSATSSYMQVVVLDCAWPSHTWPFPFVLPRVYNPVFSASLAFLDGSAIIC